MPSSLHAAGEIPDAEYSQTPEGSGLQIQRRCILAAVAEQGIRAPGDYKKGIVGARPRLLPMLGLNRKILILTLLSYVQPGKPLKLKLAMKLSASQERACLCCMCSMRT